MLEYNLFKRTKTNNILNIYFVIPVHLPAESRVWSGKIQKCAARELVRGQLRALPQRSCAAARAGRERPQVRRGIQGDRGEYSQAVERCEFHAIRRVLHEQQSESGHVHWTSGAYLFPGPTALHSHVFGRVQGLLCMRIGD